MAENKELEKKRVAVEIEGEISDDALEAVAGGASKAWAFNALMNLYNTIGVKTPYQQRYESMQNIK